MNFGYPYIWDDIVSYFLFHKKGVKSKRASHVYLGFPCLSRVVMTKKMPSNSAALSSAAGAE